MNEAIEVEDAEDTRNNDADTISGISPGDRIESSRVELQLGDSKDDAQFVRIASGDQDLLYDPDSVTYILAEEDLGRDDWVVVTVGSNIEFSNAEIPRAAGTNETGEMAAELIIDISLNNRKNKGLIPGYATVQNGMLKVSNAGRSGSAKADFELTE
ncbi:hypothetical protein [Halorubrum sp. GN11GM_10-3_MGM]|uniref:hypothetical protein n=1 Tax=Halorubrum sp. GN11GM_10-3_MGM TaxID=2518111 RepID=UPI0010F52C07|nr:hypothetical protein [Halorubrum sp. GN11GM_10-3_MGM]TKX72174.1 hypothetical protein EXE40_04850 [Halorubrum sp. GN11GM_10-3_MGM]